MAIEAEYNYLAHIPTFLFKKMLNEWQKTSIEFKPNGLLSNENRDTTLKIIQNIRGAKLKQLKKLSEILEISEIWWQAYQIQKIKPITLLKKRVKTFDVDKYLETKGVKIKGQFSIRELSEHAILIVIHFKSRSALHRRRFRFIYFPSAKIILIEPKDLALDLLKNEILPSISKEPNTVAHKRPKASLIRNFAKSYDGSGPSIVLTHLIIKISLETSGIEGLSQIIIQGDDVIRGAETLEQRHEISLKFMNSGPWIGAGTEDFKIEVGKGLQIHQLEEKSLKNLAAVLNWF